MRAVSDHVLAIDLGTASVKAVAYAVPALHQVAAATAPYQVRSPQPGWAESSPGDWERAVGLTVREALGRAAPGRLRAAGLSGQMHGVVLCTSSGAPLRPAVLWADARANDAVAVYRGLDPAMLERLGNPLVPGMAGPILHWLARYEPATYEAASWALSPKDWLRLRMTGRAGTEPSDASATLLWDLPADSWAEPVVAALGLRRDLLAPAAAPAQVAGVTNGALGLPPGVPVAYGGADTACAAYGSGLTADGQGLLSIGTGAQLVVLRDTPQPDRTRRTHLYRAVPSGCWYAMAAVQSGGLALERAWRLLEIDWPAAYELAAQVPPGCAGLTFVPHLAGERTPHLDATMRGGWVGLALHHERPHLVRAAFEGVAFTLREAFEALRDAGCAPTSLVLAGGGSGHAFWRRLLADVLELPLDAPPVMNAAARGAALLAAEARGVPVDPPAPAPATRTEPDPFLVRKYAEAYAVYRRRTPLH